MYLEICSFALLTELRNLTEHTRFKLKLYLLLTLTNSIGYQRNILSNIKNWVLPHLYLFKMI